MKHPEETTLALFAGQDLGFPARWRMARHVSRCERCRQMVDQFSALRTDISELNQLPDLPWNRLAAEMKANIRLGLAAGECVARASEPRRMAGWRAAVAYGSVAALLATGLILEHPAPPPVRAEGITLQATANGIELKQGGQTLGLMHRPAEEVLYTAGAQGAMRARYVDSETGYVTINNIYVQ